MPQSYLIFDFGTNEDAAQQARHRLEGWKQAFRLDKKLLLKFERKESEHAAEETGEAKPKTAKGQSEKSKGAKGKGEKAEAESAESEKTNSDQIRLIVRLDFSDHEKLSHHRWLERIPSEEPFKDAAPKVVRHGETDYASTADLFDTLD